MRISAPPIYHPCFYGIDTAIETELIAGSHSVEEIREFIGADSLGYLSIRGVLAALDLPYDRFCFACFDGNYPEPVPYDATERKFMLETPRPGRRADAAPMTDERRRRAGLRAGRGGRRRRRARGGADARLGGVDAPAGGAGRPRRVRVRGGDPGRATGSR